MIRADVYQRAKTVVLQGGTGDRRLRREHCTRDTQPHARPTPGGTSPVPPSRTVCTTWNPMKTSTHDEIGDAEPEPNAGRAADVGLRRRRAGTVRRAVRARRRWRAASPRRPPRRRGRCCRVRRRRTRCSTAGAERRRAARPQAVAHPVGAGGDVADRGDGAAAGACCGGHRRRWWARRRDRRSRDESSPPVTVARGRIGRSKRWGGEFCPGAQEILVALVGGRTADSARRGTVAALGESPAHCVARWSGGRSPRGGGHRSGGSLGDDRFAGRAARCSTNTPLTCLTTR